MCQSLYTEEAHETEDLSSSITRELDRLFPTEGKEEDLETVKVQSVPLQWKIVSSWFDLPPELQARIRRIEGELYRRGIEDFTLHIEPLFADGDLDDVMGMLHEIRNGEEI
jgi:hypothetical protein